jgi:hypothetical protein
MAQPQLSAESIVAIIFGFLELAVGLISLWQQRNLRGVNCKSNSHCPISSLTEVTRI